VVRVSAAELANALGLTRDAVIEAWGKSYIRRAEEPDDDLYRAGFHAIGIEDDVAIGFLLTGWKILREQREQPPGGYAKLITYTRADEPGSSPKAAGLTDDGPIRARSWNMPGRPRTDKTEIVQRRRWSLALAEPFEIEWPAPSVPYTPRLF
jgi:hypothetical protein